LKKITIQIPQKEENNNIRKYTSKKRFSPQALTVESVEERVTGSVGHATTSVSLTSFAVLETKFEDRG
jgi:phage shock protein A